MPRFLSPLIAFACALLLASSVIAGPTNFHTGRVKANQIDFSYIEAGSGPLVLLLHGYPETPIVWSAAIESLSQHGYHAVAPYMRGYPPSSAPANEDYSVRALGADALALIPALGYSHAILVGHDWGASAAYAAAFRSPHAIDKLVAVSIPHPVALEGDFSALWKADHFIYYELPFAEWWLTDPAFSHVDAIYSKWSPGWAPPRTVLDSVKESFRAKNGFHNALGYYWSIWSSRTPEKADLTGTSRIGVPTLIIAGAKDPVIDLARFQTARKGFVGPYRLAVLQNSGHFPELEEPAAFDRELIQFLGKPGRR